MVVRGRRRNYCWEHRQDNRAPHFFFHSTIAKSSPDLDRYATAHRRPRESRRASGWTGRVEGEGRVKRDRPPTPLKPEGRPASQTQPAGKGARTVGGQPGAAGASTGAVEMTTPPPSTAPQ